MDRTSSRADFRRQVIASLPNEQGHRILVTPWWVEALAAVDDPAVRELLLVMVRQTGKSQFLMALAITELFCVPNSYTVYVAAGREQAEAVYHRKGRRPFERLVDALGKKRDARFSAHGIELVSNRSALEVVASVDDTTPGRTATLLIFDEARYIGDEVYTALAPATVGAGGMIVAASTAGPPRGWFYQLVTNPQPESRVISRSENDNPHASQGVLSFLKRRLALISPASVRRELHNEFAEDGDELIGAGLIDAAIDDRLGELPASDDECFAFYDLSRRRDLCTRVVVLRDRPQRPEAADHLIVGSLRVWDPKQSPSGEVDFAEVRDDMASLTRRFPNLRRVFVDEGAEAGAVLPFARQHPRLSLLIEGFVASAASNQEMWSALVARLNARTLSVPRHDRLLGELRGLRKQEFAFGSRWRVVDGSRRYHRDLSLSLAGAVMAAGQIASCRCGDAVCDGTAPLTLGGDPEFVRWCEQHPWLNDAEPVVVVPAERLSEMLARWATLAEDDDPAADVLAEEIEQFVRRHEAIDPEVGAELRATVTVIEQAGEKTC